MRLVSASHGSAEVTDGRTLDPRGSDPHRDAGGLAIPGLVNRR